MDKWIVYTRMTRSGGLRDSMAQAILFVQNDALGRIYKSAPTSCINFMDKWIVYTRMTRSGGLRDLMARSG